MTLTDILETFKEEKSVAVLPSLEFIEKDTDGISLKGVLQRGRMKLVKEQKPRPVGLTFRPSSITYSYCRRLKVAQLAGKVEIYDEVARPAQQLVFDMGHAIHDIMQRYFWEIGLLKGSYKCIKCEKIYHDLVAPKACPSGKSTHQAKHLKYKEIVYKDPNYLISGRADGILVIEGEEHLMDIKSIANRALKTNERQFCFEDLQQPKPEHVVQLNLYMWLSKIPRAHLLYVAKNDHKIKTFAIPYNYEIIKPYLDEIAYLIGLAQNFKAGKEKVVLPAPCGKESCACEQIIA